MTPASHRDQLRAVAVRARAQEHEREPPGLVFLTAELAQTKLGDEEVERRR